MQSRLIASIVLSAGALASPAAAQRLDHSVAQYGAQYQTPPAPVAQAQAVPQVRVQVQTQPQIQPLPAPPVHTLNPSAQGPRVSRWGGRIDGRWEGGHRAPGGWAAYRRPTRGWRVPNYWIGSNFYIDDFAYYGLATPPRGYRWIRYYDDAVLIDDRGRVYDSVQGIGWDEDGDVVDQPGYGAPYPAPGVGYDGTYQGTYEIDGRTGYQQGRQSGRYAPKPPVQGGPIIQPLYPHGYTQTWSAGSGYYYPGGVTTTITVQQAPAIMTTTTTEYIEETVYRAPVRRSYRKPARKAKAKCACR